MSVEQARQYLETIQRTAVWHMDGWVRGEHRHPVETCRSCAYDSARTDAASIALDLAVAASAATATHERRREVMWADREHQRLLSEVAWA